MAYDKAVLFKCLKKLDNCKDTVTYRFTSCPWGWLAKDSELEKFIDLGETEYKTKLSPFKTIARFEKNYQLFIDKKLKQFQTYKNLYDQYKEKQTLVVYRNLVNDYNQYENLIYDKRVINVTFHKYWWESGLN